MTSAAARGDGAQSREPINLLLKHHTACPAGVVPATLTTGFIHLVSDGRGA